MQRIWSRNTPFIDFRAAYDSIDQSVLQKALADFAVPEKLINLLKLTFTNTFSMVCIPGFLRWLMVFGKGMLLLAFYLQ